MDEVCLICSRPLAEHSWDTRDICNFFAVKTPENSLTAQFYRLRDALIRIRDEASDGPIHDIANAALQGITPAR